MAGQKELFRKSSLERLSSPEQLDQLMEVTKPRGWLSLWTVGALLAVAVLWGIFGSIPDKVKGQGILIKSGGVFNIQSMSTGQVTAVYARVGELVDKGQLIARVAQPDLIEQIKKAKAELVDMKAEQKHVADYGTEEIRIKLEVLGKERANYEQSIGVSRERLKWLGEKLTNQEKLLEQGLITKQTLLNTKQEINTAQGEVSTTLNQLKQNDLNVFQLKEEKEKELRQLQQRINQSERQLAALEDNFDISSRVTSPYSGRVLEVTTDEGQLVGPGNRLLTLEMVGEAVKDLEAVIYISPTEGKKVRPGMKVEVSPSTIKQEEFGFMIGMVTHVSEFPATREGMTRVLQNDALVQSLSAGGAPIEIYADLIPDPRTVSGYKWSSPTGPPLTVQSGTICFISINVAEQSPISLVIPLFKKHVLGIGRETATLGGRR